jgi:hypothetical protein
MNIYEQAGGRWALQGDDGAVRSFTTKQEAQMAANTPAIQEYETALRTRNLPLARQLLSAFRDMSDLRAGNPEIALAIAAAEPGQLVAGTTMTKEYASLLLEMQQALATFLMTPMPVSGVTPFVAVQMRG